jgi:hypothetical protein
MTLLKRFLTSIVLFVFLFVVLYFGICIIGGGIAGATAGANHPDAQENYELGRQAGADFVRHNLRAIVFSSLGISFVSSVALSFSGIFPWCKKPSYPPKIS